MYWLLLSHNLRINLDGNVACELALLSQPCRHVPVQNPSSDFFKGDIVSTMVMAIAALHQCFPQTASCGLHPSGLQCMRLGCKPHRQEICSVRVCCNSQHSSERPRCVVQGVSDPEKKRKAIGAAFIDVFNKFAQGLKEKGGVKPTFLVQGTLYPDVIESCPPPGSKQKHSHTIKSHHNVGGLPKDLQFKLIEPLRELFKVKLSLACKIQDPPASSPAQDRPELHLPANLFLAAGICLLVFK